MNDLVKRLLAEKLIDDFYEDELRGNVGFAGDKLAECLKEHIPADKRQLLRLWEAQHVEECGRELRRFADFVAQMILDSSDRNKGQE